MRFALIVSQFNAEITQGLLSGALEFFSEKKITRDNLEILKVPGTFEIPLVAQKLARSKLYQGIICLGAVIKGETAHFEFISLGATIGLMQAMLHTEIPITFGILTTYSEEQALERSGPGANNKGREAASACYETVMVLEHIRFC